MSSTELWPGAVFKGDPVELKWNKKDLKSLVEVLKHVPRRAVAVQAGGCLGVFPKYLAREFAVVYTFEPLPENFARLCQNVPETNVIKLHAAVGDVHRLVGIKNDLRPNDGKTVLHPGMSYIEGPGIVPTLKIDDLALSACDLIYLDVEGSELDALRGADNTIVSHGPAIAFELNRGLEYRGVVPETVYAWLKRRGYHHELNARSDQLWLKNL